MTIHYRETTANSIKVSKVYGHNRRTPRSQDASSFLESSYRHGGKRLLDLMVVFLTAPFVLPFVALLALIVALDGGKPFYFQERIGRNGRIFKLWKLRSMVSNADSIFETYLSADPEARAEWDRDQKLKSDPRITKFGKLLRRTSFDELPQLWNVARGEMSLVGPRPIMVSQKALYAGQEYYKLLPGISGNWQVSDRNQSSFADRAVFDTAYYKNLSLREDLRILQPTAGVVFKATGY